MYYFNILWPSDEFNGIFFFTLYIFLVVLQIIKYLLLVSKIICFTYMLTTLYWVLFVREITIRNLKILSHYNSVFRIFWWQGLWINFVYGSISFSRGRLTRCIHTLSVLTCSVFSGAFLGISPLADLACFVFIVQYVHIYYIGIHTHAFRVLETVS